MVISLLIPIAGCKDNARETPIQAFENTKQEAALKYGDITDPVELEKLWQEYFYDAIASVCNTREFHSAQEIDPLNVAKFCWHKYVAEHGKESLALADQESTLRVFPLDTVLEYAKRYFNLSSLDVSKIETEYDPEKRAFLFNFYAEKNRPSYNANNSWGIRLDKVTRNSDGTITAVLVRNGPLQSGRIELIQTYTLKQREDGSLYYLSGRWDYVNNHLVVLTGAYQRFEQITGFAGNMEELSMLGEIDGRLLLAYTPYDKKKDAVVMLVSPKTMKVEKQLELQVHVEYSDIRLVGDRIMVCLKDKIITVDKALGGIKNTPLPQAIKAKIERIPKYDVNGFSDVFFGGYDVSGDFEKIVYADEIGVKLFNPADGSEKLLSPSMPIDSRLIQKSFHDKPRFVDHEQKVITTMLDYEGTLGYTLCDLVSGTAKNYRITSESSSTGFIRYDTGLLEVNGYRRNNQDNQTGNYQTMYLNFKTGDVKEFSLKEPGETGDIRPGDYCYVGQNFAVFITYQRDGSDNANNKFYLNRLDLKTLAVESQIISVKAAEPHILGVLADGRIVYWYSYNPSESGVCITDKRG